MRIVQSRQPATPLRTLVGLFIGLFIGLLIGALASPASLAGGAVVNQCLGPDGQRLFTQFGCPAQTTPQPHDGTSGNLSIVDAAELSRAERQALVQLEHRLEQDRRLRERTRARRQRTQAAQRTAQRAQCADAQRALAGLDHARRKGYNADQGRRFDAQEAHFRAQKRESC